jgi:hypothetical protein
MEILGYLKIEANQKDEAALPLKNEIIYLMEMMDGNSQKQELQSMLH